MALTEVKSIKPKIMKKLTILFISLFLAGSTAEAQFLKKLKKKVEQKVEQKVVDNISDKAAAETEKSLNNMWEMDLGGVPMGGEKVDPAEIPANYNFDWEYALNMHSKQGDMEFTYLLKKDAPHFGIQMPQVPGMFMVMDGERKMMVMFMDSEGNKMLTATKLDPEAIDESDAENPYKDAKIKEIGSKEILGYTCKGYQTETPDHLFTFYVTDEAGVGFSEIFQANQKNAPKGFNSDWFADGSALMMEMNMEDKKNPSNNMTMTCTRLEKKNFTINKSDYQAF